jgi:hypothetical protein
MDVFLVSCRTHAMRAGGKTVEQLLKFLKTDCGARLWSVKAGA